MSDPNDLAAYLDQAWQILGRGVADARAPARHLVLATVSPEGRPEARTVVLRGANRSNALLEIHTDIASAKIASLQCNPQAELHVWDPRRRIQLRLGVEVEVVTGQDTAKKWAHVPPASRVSYGTQPAPGTPIDHVYAYEKPVDPDRFAVLICHLQRLDLVELGEKHRRALFEKRNGFRGIWLAP